MKLSIGAGGRRLTGWTHLDIDPSTGPDVLADITQPLPFPDASVECILCEEVITQIPLEAAADFLRECRRLIIPTGVVRVLMPDLRRFLQAYFEEPEWLVDIWNRFVGLPLATGTPGEVITTGIRAVGPVMYDLETFQIIAKRAGFNVTKTDYNRSAHPAMSGIDLRRPHESVSIYLELFPANDQLPYDSAPPST